MTKRVKLNDVARKAGVSSATASRALSGNDRVDPVLAERVHAAAAALHYRRNNLARGLRRQANDVIGAVVPDITNPFFTDLVRGVEDVVREDGYLLVLCNSDETANKENSYLHALVDQQVAGIVIAPVEESGAGDALSALAGTPAVTVDRRLDGGHLDSVTLDNVIGAHRLAAHLLEAASDVALIAGPSHTSTGRERREGYEQARAEARPGAGAAVIVESDFSEAGGYEAAVELLDRGSRPEAILSANNAMTLGLLRAMSERGIRTADLPVASFDPLPWSADPAQRVVALAVPTYEMGQNAARMLVERLRNEDGPPRAVCLEPGEILFASAV